MLILVKSGHEIGFGKAESPHFDAPAAVEAPLSPDAEVADDLARLPVVPFAAAPPRRPPRLPLPDAEAAAFPFRRVGFALEVAS